MRIPTLYVYVDESGNFDFCSTGTKHLVMSAFATPQPLESARELAKLKYELLSDGVNLPNFHASDDRQGVRDKVLGQISLMKDVSAHTFWIRKDEPSFEGVDTVGIYEIFGHAIAQAVKAELRSRDLAAVVVVFDKALMHRDEQAFLSRAKAIFSKMNHPFQIYFHNVSKDFNGQIADYIAWSHYVALERNELRPLDVLPPALTANLENLAGRRDSKD